MEIKAKLIKLENSGYRYAFSIIWICFCLIQMSTAYQRYSTYVADYSDIAQGYLRMFFLLLVSVVIMIGFTVFIAIVDAKVKNKEKYLILRDAKLYLPNSITKKVKEIKLEDIDNIGLEGFTQEKVRINMKTTEFMFAPRIYNVFDKNIKDIYNILNDQIVSNRNKSK